MRTTLLFILVWREAVTQASYHGKSLTTVLICEDGATNAKGKDCTVACSCSPRPNAPGPYAPRCRSGAGCESCQCYTIEEPVQTCAFGCRSARDCRSEHTSDHGCLNCVPLNPLSKAESTLCACMRLSSKTERSDGSRLCWGYDGSLRTRNCIYGDWQPPVD